jgi:hypothetical protein
MSSPTRSGFEWYPAGDARGRQAPEAGFGFDSYISSRSVFHQCLQGPDFEVLITAEECNQALVIYS